VVKKHFSTCPLEDALVAFTAIALFNLKLFLDLGMPLRAEQFETGLPLAKTGRRPTSSLNMPLSESRLA
jgi:hypothetical protein